MFFAVLLGVYWSLPWQRARVWLLVAASFYFYATWNKWLAIVLCISTFIDYILALGIEQSISSGRRKILLCISLFANLGLLCYFKYANFFLLSLDEVLIAAGSPGSAGGALLRAVDRLPGVLGRVRSNLGGRAARWLLERQDATGGHP